MEADFRLLIPVSTKCPHENVVWNILETTSSTVRVKVTCQGCRYVTTETVSY